MNDSSDQPTALDVDPDDDVKKSLHPFWWMLLGVIIYIALQAWVFPKVSLPT